MLDRNNVDVFLSGVVLCVGAALLLLGDGIKMLTVGVSLVLINLLYILIRRSASEELAGADRIEYLRLSVDPRLIYICYALAFSVAVLRSPLVVGANSYLYAALVTGLVVLLLLATLSSEVPRVPLLLMIIATAILVRGAIHFQFETPPGIDAVVTHYPAILMTFESHSIQSPSYYEVFFTSQLRAVLGMFVLDVTARDAAYLTLFLPQAISVLFVYLVGRQFSKPLAGVSALFVGVVAFHIPYGAYRIPQSTSITLLPLLLYLIFFSERNWRRYVVLFVLFLAFFLTHNISPWILFGFAAVWAAIEFVLGRFSFESHFENVPIYLLFSFSAIKLWYIVVSEYTYNVGRLVNVVSFLLGASSFGGVPTASRTGGSGEFVFLLFASTYLVVGCVLAFVVLFGVHELLVGRATETRSAWLFAIGLIWGLFGATLLFGPNVGIERASGALSVIIAPVIVLFVKHIYGSSGRWRNVAIILAIVSLVAFTSVIHPRANVGDTFRTEQVALTTDEVSGLQFSETYTRGYSTDDYTGSFRWYVGDNGRLRPEGGGEWQLDRIRVANATAVPQDVIYDSAGAKIRSNRSSPN